MEPFRVLRSPAVLIDLGPVDTDQIIPARFIKHRRGPAYRRYLFHDRRFGPDGTPRPDFPLQEGMAGNARILVSTGPFGVGSSREGAVWALAEFGFRAVLAPSFGDVFYSNCVRNGVLPIVLPPADLAAMGRAPGTELIVDLSNQQVELLAGARVHFEIDRFDKEMLEAGLDEIGLTERHLPEIDAFETRHERAFQGVPSR